MNPHDNKNLHISKGYICETDTGEDTLDLSFILTEPMVEVIQYLLKKNMNISDYFDIVVYKSNLVMTTDDIEIDWANLKLINKTPEETGFTVALYVDVELMNKIKYRLDSRKQIYHK